MVGLHMADEVIHVPVIYPFRPISAFPLGSGEGMDERGWKGGLQGEGEGMDGEG